MPARRRARPRAGRARASSAGSSSSTRPAVARATPAVARSRRETASPGEVSEPRRERPDERSRRRAPDPGVEAVDGEQQPDRQERRLRAPARGAPVARAPAPARCPAANESATVTPNAGQNRQPWLISAAATNAASVARAACAKLIDPARAADEHDAERQQPVDPTRRETGRDLLRRPRSRDAQRRIRGSVGVHDARVTVEHHAPGAEDERTRGRRRAPAPARCSATTIAAPALVQLAERREHLARDGGAARPRTARRRARAAASPSRRSRAPAGADRPPESAPAANAAPLVEEREQLEDPRVRVVERPAPRPRPEPQVVEHGERRERSAPLRHVRDPRRAIAAGDSLADRLALEEDLARDPRSTRAIARRSVVLPAPFAPTTATNSPSSIVSETPRSACVSACHASTSRSSSRLTAAPATAPAAARAPRPRRLRPGGMPATVP